jgi:hypothetical protein
LADRIELLAKDATIGQNRRTKTNGVLNADCLNRGRGEHAMPASKINMNSIEAWKKYNYDRTSSG